MAASAFTFAGDCRIVVAGDNDIETVWQLPEPVVEVPQHRHRAGILHKGDIACMDEKVAGRNLEFSMQFVGITDADDLHSVWRFLSAIVQTSGDSANRCLVSSEPGQIQRLDNFRYDSLIVENAHVGHEHKVPGAFVINDPPQGWPGRWCHGEVSSIPRLLNAKIVVR